MLQQTQVDTVIPYFERWMARFPTLASLAEAEEDQVLSLWQGLGYYSRARALLQSARTLQGAGLDELPASAERLRELPGIGRYTAGAIASIAFGHDVPLVDGNVVRVLTRYFGLSQDPTREPLKGALWKLCQQLLVRGRAGDFNQALMELGALVCRPRAPICTECPLRQDCRARSLGTPEAFPATPARPRVTLERTAAAVARRRGALLLVRAPHDAPRWAGLWSLPHAAIAPGETAAAAAARALHEQTGLLATSTGALGNLRHSITRFRYALEWHAMSPPRGRLRNAPGPRACYHDLDTLRELAMPAPHRVICESLGHA